MGNDELLTPVHCKNCAKKFMEAAVLVATIICPRCKYKADYRILSQSFIEELRKQDVAQL